MIVICGVDNDRASSRGRAAEVAARAAAAGSEVQLVSVVTDDGAGDQRLFALTSAGVGHAAVLRGPARDLDPADVDLALRYLPEIRVIVTVGLADAAVATASEYANWSGAALVIVASPRADHGSGRAGDRGEINDDAIVLEAPPSDPDGTFAGFVGALAVRLDGGEAPADAWAATTRELAVDPA